jgi:hypothetical protein
MERLGLTDEELCTVLDADPLTLLTDELPHRPEVDILLELTAEFDPVVLRRWVRTGPLDLLLRRDFAAFEDALGDLQDRGFVIRARR